MAVESPILPPERKDTRNQGFSNWVVLPIALFITCPVVLGGYWLADQFTTSGITWAAVLFGGGSWLAWGASALTGTAWMYRRACYDDHEERQWQRMEQVKATLEAVKSGTLHRDFYVYLRSFKSEDLEGDWYNLMTSASGSMWATTFTDELAFVFDGVGDLLCLGDDAKAAQLGVARVSTTDEEWRTLIRQLLDHCAGIVMMPWFTASVSEEFAYIASRPELLRKTAFFMPPERAWIFMSAIWQKTREEAQKRGADLLPEYRGLGGLFNARGNFISFVGTIHSREALRAVIMVLIGKWKIEEAGADAVRRVTRNV